MHYGHAIEFGTFLTPRSDSPQAVVDLAVLSERLGYDLVTFQDHPYQPAFLDTWTLLSWAAARTQRIHLAPNVANLPLRPPAVLARAAASLDLLSDGRLDLALGAGAFWDAIAAMGGRRQAPAEAVAALSEAIDVIRGIWDVGDEAPVRLAGDHHRLAGAQPGPVPAHDIAIWVGAAKPRMLRLIGRKADGWLPTLGYLKPGELRNGNKIIDEAAGEAGRDPREIRRLANISGRFTASRGGFLEGPSEQWVEELLPLAVEEGVSTFILMSDDAATLEQFAAEVAPALRAAVDREVPEALPGPRLRRAAVRAKRHPGVNYDRVPPSLADSVVEPGDPGYARGRSTYARGGSPAMVIQPRSTADVVDALAFARTHPHLPLGIRSGGHGISGRSTNDGGIVIDLSNRNEVEILDQSSRRVRIGPGARWGDVAVELQPYGWALSSGDYGGVGVGGLATTGGIGWLARAHGLTIDHVRAVAIVLADGSVVAASEQENQDLFWAVRGAGANFGIVTSFEFEADEVSDVGWAQFVFDAGDLAGFLERWGAAVEASPRDLTSFLMTRPPRRGEPMVVHVMAMVASPDPSTVAERLRPLAAVAPVLDHVAVTTSYASVMANAQGSYHRGAGEPVGRSGLVDHLTPQFAAMAADVVGSRAAFFFQIRSVGGAVADVDPDATAYANRLANFAVNAFGVSRARLDAAWDRLHGQLNGLYPSFETDQRPERLADAFPPGTLRRLRELKARYDPDNVFRDNFNIAPQAQVGAHG